MIQPSPPRVYADFNNADAKGRVRLNCAGTARDLARNGFKLSPGAVVMLYDGDNDADAEGQPDALVACGVVEYSD